MNNEEELTNYKKIRGIISDNDNPLKATAIKGAIREGIGSDNNRKYADAIIHFFNVSIRNGDPDAKKLFQEVFCDDLVKHCEFFEPTGEGRGHGGPHPGDGRMGAATHGPAREPGGHHYPSHEGYRRKAGGYGQGCKPDSTSYRR